MDDIGARADGHDLHARGGGSAVNRRAQSKAVQHQAVGTQLPHAGTHCVQGRIGHLASQNFPGLQLPHLIVGDPAVEHRRDERSVVVVDGLKIDLRVLVELDTVRDPLTGQIGLLIAAGLYGNAKAFPRFRRPSRFQPVKE
ncbi:MAG: hypothetical protein QM296_11230 [Bacillota bacterium]|nr:hypothetical protein [Bacillota bacterium]